MTDQPIYQKEINFINRKAPAMMIKWEAREIISQLISPLMAEPEANRLYDKLHEAFLPKAGSLRIMKLLQKKLIDNSKLTYRVIIAVSLLREIFSVEIDGFDGGGGGPGLNKAKAERAAAANNMRRR